MTANDEPDLAPDAEARAALFQSIIESMGESVLLVDREGRQIYANKELRRFQGEVPPGEDPDAWRSPTVMRIFDADGAELPADQWPVARALRGDYADNFEIRVDGMAHRPDETTVLAISTRARFDAAGEIHGAVIVTRDITTLRQTEEKLQQSQKLETIGQLTGGVAHDFNNMLSAIISAVEVLKNGVSGNERLEHAAGIIEKAALRGADLTRHLLAFARRQTLQATAVSIDAILRDTLQLVRPALDATVEIKITSEEGLFAFADEAQLTSALLNLCINARDAMPNGGGLTISAAPAVLEGGGSYVRLAVSDTGVGMSPATLSRAIEPFFTTKGVGKGSGLGLSMVFGFARQSGGDMQIDSVEGRGTTVSLFLPRTEKPAETTPTAPPPRPGRMRVLVVDDDALVRDALCLQLDDEGFEALVAEDGVQALEMVESGVDFDVLLTDMVMPRGMSGVALATAVAERRPNVRIILSTGYADKAVTPPAGVHWALLQKPYTADQLFAALRAAMLR